MTIEKNFIRRLQEERRKRRWSQAELSRRVAALGHELKKDAMSKIESGDRRVTLDDAVALAAALDVPLPGLLLTGGQGEIALAPKLKVREPFVAGWLAGAMPLNRHDVESYEGAGGHLLDMGLLARKVLPDLLSAKPNHDEVEMARAYVKKERRTWEMLEEAGSRAGVPTGMAQEMRDMVRSARDDMARIEALLPKERKR